MVQTNYITESSQSVVILISRMVQKSIRPKNSVFYSEVLMKESGSFSPLYGYFLHKENVFAVKKLLQVQMEPRCEHIIQSHASITRTTLSLCCFCCQNL